MRFRKKMWDRTFQSTQLQAHDGSLRSTTRRTPPIGFLTPHPPGPTSHAVRCRLQHIPAARVQPDVTGAKIGSNTALELLKGGPDAFEPCGGLVFCCPTDNRFDQFDHVASHLSIADTHERFCECAAVGVREKFIDKVWRA